MAPRTAPAADVGVVGTRLAITSNARTGKASLLFSAKGPGIAFGPASAASEVSGSLVAYYVDAPANRASLALPAPWSGVDARVARFQNKLAPAGPTAVRNATIRAGKMARVMAKGTGGIDLSQPPGPGGVLTVLTIENAGDGSTHRMCSLFATSAGSKIVHRALASGSRLTLSKDVPAACPTCSDGVRNGLETGVDCGGPECPACGNGEACNDGSDCQTGVCTSGVCAVPARTGGVQDGDETGVDCGGPTCPACGPGQGCQVASDCTSGVCTANLCQAPSCGDGVENGGELDVDCGGPCPACVPFTVTLDAPAHGLFTLAGSATVTGHTTGVGPAGADLTVNGVPVPLAPDGTFSTVVPLFPELVFNPIAARLVRRFDGLTAHDRIVVVAGDAIADGDYSPNGVAMRINDTGLDAIEPVATTLVDIDPATLVPAGTKVMEDYCYAPVGSVCFGSVDVTISGTPPPTVGPLSIAVDSQTNAIDGDISIEDLRVTVNIDSSSGIPIHCELAITVGLTQIFGDYGLSPLASQPTKVDVTQMGDVVVQASDTSHVTNCGGLFGDLTEALIGSAIGDVGALFAGGMQDFLNSVDAAGNTPIAAAIETALAGIDIAGPVGSGLGIDLDAPFTSIVEDPTGRTFAADIAATTLAPLPGAPDLLASYHVDEAFPAFGPTSPVQGLPYGIGLGISTSGFNQLLRAQIENGLLPSTLTEITLNDATLPLNAGLLAVLLPEFGQLPPTTPIAIRVTPTLAPVLTGAAGPNGELGELLVSHVVVEFVQDAGLPSEQVHLVLAVDARLGLDLAFQQGGIGFALSPPTAADVTVALLEDPLGIGETALQGFLPSVLAGFLPDLASALQSFPLPSFLGLSLSGVEVSRSGEYYAIFADLTPACVGGSVCPSGVCLDGTCQAASCTDGVKNGDETDVDCGGGTCGGCEQGKACEVGTDCVGLVCTEGVCQPESCADGVQNGNETDVDCGGSCAACPDGACCSVPPDCQSGVCTGDVCRAPACDDGVKNGSETALDCGGPCSGCAAGEACNVGADCASGVCTGNVCQMPTCSDGVENGAEIDVDCGGPSCGDCAVGQGCASGGDCVSGVCTGNVCQAPTCSDGVKNGTETDVDCGGPTCNQCALNQVCATSTDCQTNFCTGNRCKCPMQDFTFQVDSNGGGLFDSAEWPGGTATQSGPPGCSVTINRPNNNVDLVCTLGAPFSVNSFTGYSTCFGTGGEDGDGCQPVSCPPAGIGSCCSGRPSCSAALNGSARARYFVRCNP